MCNLSYIINLSCYKLNKCYIKLSLVNILEMVFGFIEILFKMLLFKGVYSFTLSTVHISLFGPTWEFLHSLLDGISEFTEHFAGLNGLVFI